MKSHKFKEKIEEKLRNHFSVGGIEIKIIDPLPDSVDLRSVANKIIKMIPRHLLGNIDLIKVGNFEKLQKRSLDAMYQNSVIYLSNNHDKDSDIIDDLVHEIAHSNESRYKQIIYGDKVLKKEFLAKRKILWRLLKEIGHRVELSDFLNHKFSSKLDNMFYKEIGYQNLGIYTSNLFYSPYAATSLREYFANGFEAFFMKEDVSKLKKVSPVLYQKIVDLAFIKEKTYN